MRPRQEKKDAARDAEMATKKCQFTVLEGTVARMTGEAAVRGRSISLLCPSPRGPQGKYGGTGQMPTARVPRRNSCCEHFCHNILLSTSTRAIFGGDFPAPARNFTRPGGPSLLRDLCSRFVQHVYLDFHGDHLRIPHGVLLFSVLKNTIASIKA